MNRSSFLLAAWTALVPGLAMSAPDPLVAGVALEQSRWHEGQAMAWAFRLSRPAPPEGLQLQIALAEDSDPTPDDLAYNVTGGQGIVDFALDRRPDGTIAGMRVHLAGGVTAATMVVEVVRDSIPEAPETGVWILLAGDGYQVDAERSRIEYVLLDTE